MKYAVFEGDRRTATGRVDVTGDLQELPLAEEVVAVSVNPAALARIRNRYPAVRAVGEDLPLPLAVNYDPPGDCGHDRVLGAFGALERHSEAEGVLLLDAGTCLTATVATRAEGVLGGAILPGAELMARSLHEHTGQLPLVEPGEPQEPLGRSTAESIRSGIHHAQAGAANELIRTLRGACATPLLVVAAGSGAGSLAAAVPEIDALHLFATLWGVYFATRD